MGDVFFLSCQRRLAVTNRGRKMVEFEDFETQWLEEIRAGNPSTTELGNRFAQKIIRDLYDVDDTGSELIVCDGAGDGGIDAAIFLKADKDEGIEGDTWLLIQAKFNSAMAGPETIILEAQKVFSTLKGDNKALSSLSSELVERLRNFLSNVGPHDRLEYVLATTRKLTPEESRYLHDVRTLGRTKFGECFDIDSVSIETIYNKVCEEEKSATTSLSVTLRTHVSSSSDELLIGATTLTDVFAFMRDYKVKSGDLDMLYEKNVRKHLGSKRKVNKGIEKTIAEYPERFGLFNNGITFVCEGFTQDTDGVLTLVNPYIVNGCQTTRSIWSVLMRKLNSGGKAPSQAQQEWEARLARAVVVTKIVVIHAGSEQLLTDTTRYTNSQNAVTEKDFIALEDDFKRWGPAFSRRFNVYLEIQRGAWEARRALQKQNPLALPRFAESANAFDLLKAYAAGWLVEPGIAYGKNAPFAPDGTLFKKIVNEEGFGVESLFAAYQMQRLANNYGFGRGAQKSTRGQTRFLFIFVAVDLVKDLLVHLNRPRSNPELAAAVVKLADAGLLKDVGDAAVGVIDDYLTYGAEDSIFTEPDYVRTNDLNAFLKSDKLGKSDEFSPNLKLQLGLAKRLYRRQLELDEVKAALTDAE